MKNISLITGIIIVSVMSLLGILAGWMAPFDPSLTDITKELISPNSTHFLGTDQDGIDIWSQILYGARISLGISLSITLICCTVGLLLGTLSGYYGNRVDQVIMRITDLVLAFPGLLLAIALAATLGPSLFNLILALSLTGWASYARLVRGEVLALKEKEFIQAARAIGNSNSRIFVFHLWPNLIPVLLVQMTFGIAGVMISESSLSFLGIGAPTGTPSWGLLLSQGKDVLLEAPHVALFPGLALALVTLGFYFLGDGLQEKLSPRQANEKRSDA